MEDHPMVFQIGIAHKKKSVGSTIDSDGVHKGVKGGATYLSVMNGNQARVLTSDLSTVEQLKKDKHRAFGPRKQATDDEGMVVKFFKKKKKKRSQLKENGMPHCDPSKVTRVEFDPKDPQKFVVGDSDHVVRVWKMTEGGKSANCEDEDCWRHEDIITAIAVHPTRAQIASAGGDAKIHIWDERQKKIIACFPRAQKFKTIQAQRNMSASTLTYNPYKLDELAVGYYNGMIYFWDVTSKDCIRRIRHAEKYSVRGIHYIDHELMATTGNSDVVLWDIERGAPLRRLTHKACFLSKALIRGSAYIPEEAVLVTGTKSGRLYRWDLGKFLALYRYFKNLDRDNCEHIRELFYRIYNLVQADNTKIKLELTSQERDIYFQLPACIQEYLDTLMPKEKKKKTKKVNGKEYQQLLD